MGDDGKNVVRFRIARTGEEEREATLAEFLEVTATGFPGRPGPSPEEVAAADELTALTGELGLYGDDPDCG